MSTSNIKDHIKFELWGRAAGRCEYAGCNKPIYLDDLTKFKVNAAYIAHIYADKQGGPRWHPSLSMQLRADICNLMLLCDMHHRLIDRGDVAGHPADKLIEMKRNHEDRIELLADIKRERRSEILLYGAKIGEHDSPVTYDKARMALIPEHYPASNTAIEIGISNSALKDRDPEYWKIELLNLRRHYANQVKDRLATRNITHLSIFAIAPQPLLIELGRLLSDLPSAKVFQLHREPPDWIWQNHSSDIDFHIIAPETNNPIVALNLSISATITNERISAVLGDQCSIWTLTVPSPGLDILKSSRQLQTFREEFRRLLDTIKSRHGGDTVLHVFPSVPVAIAVEIGRVWMSKADLPLVVYEQQRELGGFVYALSIGSHGNDA